ncbi:MAG: twin-arginine translocase subunit TatC [Schwartzia sp.]|nr:twin-arginine translocase subunit TatC [Schwartzia sp. (in: firmicutes)]
MHLAAERREHVDKPFIEVPEDDSDVVADEAEDNEEADDGNMSLVAHLEELRARILRALAAVVVGSIVSYWFIDEIMAYITLPVGKLYYLQPAEAFLMYVKITVFSGFLLALPVIFYQIWRFILPALTVKERVVIGLLVPSSVLLFFAGLAFAFFLVLPAAVRFFMGLGSDALAPMFTLHQYFDFMLSILLPFGAVFELPLVLVVLARFGIVTSAFMRSKRKHIILWAFVLGALLTPPDVFTQTMIALPLILLYELSYYVVKYVLRK